MNEKDLREVNRLRAEVLNLVSKYSICLSEFFSGLDNISFCYKVYGFIDMLEQENLISNDHFNQILNNLVKIYNHK